MIVSLAAIHYKIHYVQYRSQRCITTPSKHKVKVQNITTRTPKQNNTTNVRSMFSDKYPVACVLQPRSIETSQIHSCNSLSTLFHDESTLVSYILCL